MQLIIPHALWIACWRQASASWMVSAVHSNPHVAVADGVKIALIACFWPMSLSIDPNVLQERLVPLKMISGNLGVVCLY